MPRRANATNANGARTPVKSQRRVNQQQPARNGAKKNGGTQKENKQQNAPVGFSGVPLSSRFSSLKKEVQKSASKPAKGGKVMVNVKKGTQAKGLNQATGRKAKQHEKLKKEQVQRQEKQKMQQVAQGNRNKRQAAVNQRRKGLPAAAPSTKAGTKTTIAVKAKKTGPKNGAKGKGPKPKEEKKAPVTGEDLDIEMDSYWHKAGKGPDPHQALLDRQMDQYWADKPKRDGDDAQTTTA